MHSPHPSWDFTCKMERSKRNNVKTELTPRLWNKRMVLVQYIVWVWRLKTRKLTAVKLVLRICWLYFQAAQNSKAKKYVYWSLKFILFEGRTWADYNVTYIVWFTVWFVASTLGLKRFTIKFFTIFQVLTHNDRHPPD